MTKQRFNATPGYYPSPWSGEDGGPHRLQAASGLRGLDIQADESLKIKASRRLSTGNMVVLRAPGEVYLMHVDTLRDKLGMHCYSHVEKLDPETLKPIMKSPKLPGGTWWPGGFCVHRNGDLYVTFGRWVHRLNPDCELLTGSLPQLVAALDQDTGAAIAGPAVVDRQGQPMKGTMRRFPNPWNAFLTFSGLWRMGRFFPAFQGVDGSTRLPATTVEAEAVSSGWAL